MDNKIIIGVVILIILALAYYFLVHKDSEAFGQGAMLCHQVPDNWAWMGSRGHKASCGCEGFEINGQNVDKNNLGLALAQSSRMNFLRELGCEVPSAAVVPDVLSTLKDQQRMQYITGCEATR